MVKTLGTTKSEFLKNPTVLWATRTIITRSYEGSRKKFWRGPFFTGWTRTAALELVYRVEALFMLFPTMFFALNESSNHPPLLFGFDSAIFLFCTGGVK
jgi:hypothetical protein